MNIDITAIIQALIALCTAIITALVIPWVKAKLGTQNTETLLTWVSIAAQAAEQLYTAADGEAKKQYVLDFLENKGYAVDETEIDTAIESAVLKLHAELYGATKEGTDVE